VQILETYSSASECAIMVCLKQPFENSRVARTIKQKRLANRDKNPATIFFCSLPRDRRATGRVVEFHACQHGQKTNAVVVFRLFQASFVWRPGWVCSWLLEIRGWKGVRSAFAEKGGKDMGCIVRKGHVWMPPEGRNALSSSFIVSVAYRFSTINI